VDEKIGKEETKEESEVTRWDEGKRKSLELQPKIH